jgi:hypothetical protein
MHLTTFRGSGGYGFVTGISVLDVEELSGAPFLAGGAPRAPGLRIAACTLMHDPAAVRSAANTAASWVRARRAAWTDAEATFARIAAEAAPPEPEVEPVEESAAPAESASSGRGWSVGRLIGRLRPGRAET